MRSRQTWSVAGLILLASCGGKGVPPTAISPSSPAPATRTVAPSPSPSPVVINGTLIVKNQSFELCLPQVDGSPARLRDGYSDIGEGTEVTVYDPAGTIIGTGQLADVHGTDRHGFRDDCAFSFQVTVPEEPFYSVEVSHRGKVAFQRSEISDAELTLG